MAELTLQDLSPNSTQDADFINLSKTDLGLTGATNSLDQVVAAIAIKSKDVMTQERYDAEPAQNLYVSNGFDSFPTRDNATWQQRQIVINLTKLDDTELNPGDY